MKDILRKVFNKLKKFNNGLIVPCDFVLVDAIMNHLDENPYTIQELNKLLSINDEPKVMEILNFLIKEEFIRKTDFTDNTAGSAILSPLYFSQSYEEKFLKAIENNSMTIPELYKHLACTDEFKIMAMIGILASENKIEPDDFPDGIKTIYREDGGAMHLGKYRKTKSSVSDQKE